MREFTITQLPALEAISQLEIKGIRPRLVYIDPPFNAGKVFKYIGKKVESRSENFGVSFNDKWDSLEDYMDFLRPILEGIHRILADDGSILVHCDHRANTYISLELDRIFGMGDKAKNDTPGFRNEIIWTYELGGRQKRCFPKKHDNIYWYSKGSEWTFNPIIIPGRTKKVPTKRQTDVMYYTFNNSHSERVGYPTQKPTKIIEDLVCALSNPGDLVADFFCGSGTTGVCAVRHGRNAWLSDQSEDAIRVAQKRVEEAFSKSNRS